MPLGITICRFSFKFGIKNRAMLVRKCIEKSILSEQTLKANNYEKPWRIRIENIISGVEISIEDRSNIEQKMKPRWGWLLTSIFHGFSSIWGPSWAVWKAPWSHLASLGGTLGHLGSVLDCLRRVLEPYWRPLWPSWSLLRAKSAKKNLNTWTESASNIFQRFLF